MAERSGVDDGPDGQGHEVRALRGGGAARDRTCGAGGRSDDRSRSQPGVGQRSRRCRAWSRSVSAKTVFTAALTTGLLVLLTRPSRLRMKCTRQRCQPAPRTLLVAALRPLSPLAGHAFQHVHDPLSRQRNIHLDRRALPSAIVLEPGSAELAAIGQRVAREVERPALVGGNRAPSALTPLARDLPALCAAQPAAPRGRCARRPRHSP